MFRLTHVTFCALFLFFSPICFGQTVGQTIVLPKPAVKLASPISQVEARTYDLSDTIAAYIENSELPAEEARAEAISHIFTPFIANADLIRREEISPGKFSVLATESFHEGLPGVLEWIKHGKKLIRLEARVLTVTEEFLRDLHAEYKGQWETSTADEVDATNLAKPRKPQSPFAFATFKKPTDRPADFISATTKTVRVLPSRVARLTSEQTKALIAAPQCNVLLAPKISIFPGQQASIADTTQRPFVVAVQPVKGDKDTALQPIINVLEDGMTIQLRASLCEDERLDIDGEITFKRIGNVDSFTFQTDDSGEGTTIQIPEQHVRQIRLSKRIDDGGTLLIDPYFFEEKTTKRRFRRSVTTRQYTLVMFTPHVTQEAPDVVE